jgi:polyhydroxybutyrate depolymerase
VGYSNGGHLLFRAAFEDPAEFTGLAVIGAHLPVPEEEDCRHANKAVSIFLVSGTDDPVSPWTGGEVQIPGGGSPGHVLSAAASAELFQKLAGAPETPIVEVYPDRDTADGARVETRRWVAKGGAEVVLMIVYGGGHTLPYPTANFPAQFVGGTSRDLDGAKVIWDFFARHLQRR